MTPIDKARLGYNVSEEEIAEWESWEEEDCPEEDEEE